MTVAHIYILNYLPFICIYIYIAYICLYRGFGSESPFSYKFPPTSHVKRRKTEEDEETIEDSQMTPHTPQKKDREGDEKEEKAASEEAKGTTKTVHPRRIWSTKMQTSEKHYMK